MPLGAAFSETLASLASASHSFWAEAISLNKLVVQEDVGIVIIFHACPINGNHSLQMPIVHLSSKNMGTTSFTDSQKKTQKPGSAS